MYSSMDGAASLPILLRDNEDGGCIRDLSPLENDTNIWLVSQIFQVAFVG